MTTIERKPSRKLGLWPLVAFTLLGLGLLWSTGPRPSTLKGALAPDFELTLPSGKTRRLSSLRGQVVLLNFWAPWCGPCVEEMPDLADLERAMAGKSFALYAVNVDESAKEMFADFKKDLAPRNIVSAVPEEVADAYGVSVLPTTVLIDREGVVREVYFGPRDWKARPILDRIRALL